MDEETDRVVNNIFKRLMQAILYVGAANFLALDMSGDTFFKASGFLFGVEVLLVFVGLMVGASVKEKKR